MIYITIRNQVIDKTNNEQRIVCVSVLRDDKDIFHSSKYLHKTQGNK